MGFTRARVGRDRAVRFQALYTDVKGRRRSAGTFSTEKAATRAWQRAEVHVAEGRIGDPRRGQQRFRRYVLEEWLPHHEIEARTRENYTYYLERLILPEFGPMRMVEILPLDVRRWVTTLKSDGVSPTVIRYAMTVLSAIFTTALNDQVIKLHPCRGVKTPPVPKRLRTIISPEQFNAIYAAIPSERMRLLTELAIETGLRWGELTELRPKDIDFTTRMLTVSRVVVELVPKFHPTGERFLVKPYPKDKEYRQLKLSVDIAGSSACMSSKRGSRRTISCSPCRIHHERRRCGCSPTRRRWAGLSPTGPGAGTAMARSVRTPRGGADADAARTPTPATAPSAGRPARTSREAREWLTLTGTSSADGSGRGSGFRRSGLPTSRSP
jgi:integrase